MARLAPSRSVEDVRVPIPSSAADNNNNNNNNNNNSTIHATAQHDLDQEIARHAEVIRKERQSRRIEVAHESMDSALSNNLISYEPPPISAPSIHQQQRLSSSDQPNRSSTRDQNKRRVSGHANDVHGGVLVGNLIGEGHVNYVLMYNMLTGIRIGVCYTFLLNTHTHTHTQRERERERRFDSFSSLSHPGLSLSG
jgi:1-phosphatidylinositol-4-phosphate 5-kinase